MTTQTMNDAQRKALRLCVKRGALHLIEPVAAGSVAEREAREDTAYHLERAIILASRGNRIDLAGRLVAVLDDLRRSATAAPEAPLPVADKPRRKLAAKRSPGQRAKAKLAKRGAAIVAI